MAQPKSDPLAGGREIKPNTVAFGKVGNYIKGTYTGVKQVKTDKGVTNLYELKGDIGVYNPIENSNDENGNKQVKVLDPIEVKKNDYYQVWGGKDTIDSGFRKIKFGTVVGIQFKEAIPSKKAGNSPFKVFRFVEYGPDPDYAGEDSNAQLDAARSAGLVDDEAPPFA